MPKEGLGRLILWWVGIGVEMAGEAYRHIDQALCTLAFAHATMFSSQRPSAEILTSLKTFNVIKSIT